MTKKSYSKPCYKSFELIPIKEVLAAIKFLNGNSLIEYVANNDEYKYLCNICSEYLRDIQNRTKGWC